MSLNQQIIFLQCLLSSKGRSKGRKRRNLTFAHLKKFSFLFELYIATHPKNLMNDRSFQLLREKKEEKARNEH